MRLQEKTLAVALPVALVGGSLLALVSRRVTESIMTREAARRVLPQAEDAAARMSPAAATGREELLLPRVQAVQAFSGAAYAAVVSSSGVVLAHTNVLEKGQRRPDEATRRALASPGSSIEEVVEDGKQRLFLGLPIWRVEDDFLLSGKDRTRVGTLLLALPLDATLESARRAGTQVVVLVLLFCAAVFAGTLGLLRLILGRLRVVADATRKVAGGDYSAVVPAGDTDELGELARAFNNMSGVLSRTVVSRDRLEEALSIARATLDASADGILVVGDDLKIITHNRRFSEIWGLPKDVTGESSPVLVAKVSDQLTHPEAFSGKSTASYSDFAVGQRSDLIHFKDGRVYERVSRPYLLDGKAAGRTFTFRDLSPFMEAERVKAQFMANVSHELRTPLNAVVGAAGLLRGTRLDAGQQESVETLSRAANSLLDLIDDVLDFSKIEAERMTMEREILRPAEVLSDAAALIAPAAAEKKLLLTVNTSEAEGLVVLGDPSRLRQILLNMLSNALKFTETGEISARLRVIDLRERRADLEFSVHDTGIGITLEQGKRLFAPFSQADGSTTRRYGGTGLGLSISKSLAELMGGEFSYESEPGRGTRFWLKVRLDVPEPANSGPAEPAALPPASGAPRDRLRVLVVEDNPINRRLLVRQLARLGCAADEAATGGEAIEALRADDYGLILMDCQMPGLDGFETTAEVRRLEAGRRRVPIVALTANATENDRRRCLDSGMDDFMAKPATLESLHAALERWDAPFDEKALENFRSIADDRSALQDFLDDAGARLAAARRALAEGALPEVSAAAHSLKGAAAAVGARGLRELARRVEEAVEHGDDAPLASLLEQAEAELARVKGKLSA